LRRVGDFFDDFDLARFPVIGRDLLLRADARSFCLSLC
jgi:hypothetical protein